MRIWADEGCQWQQFSPRDPRTVSLRLEPDGTTSEIPAELLATAQGVLGEAGREIEDAREQLIGGGQSGNLGRLRRERGYRGLLVAHLRFEIAELLQQRVGAFAVGDQVTRVVDPPSCAEEVFTPGSVDDRRSNVSSEAPSSASQRRRPCALTPS